MFKTQKNQIRGLSQTEYLALQELCRLSKNLYNVGLYSVRQFFFAEKAFLRYESNYHQCKTNENYQLLNTDIAQQTLKVVDRSFRSFFNLIKKAKSGNYQFNQISLPRYLKKDGYFSLIIPRIKVKDGFFKVPTSREFKAKYGEVKLPFPDRLVDKSLKEVRIHPKYNCQFFEVEFITEEELQIVEFKSDNALCIDLGLNNLATCVSTNGASFIIDGHKLKSYNHWYNKSNAKLQSIKDKQGTKGVTKRQGRLLLKRNNQIRDYLSKTARYIIENCLRLDIGTLIVGTNKGWKQDINIGKRNNQNFVQIPFYSLKEKLKSLCETYGIQYIEQEESYTSKASALDNDPIPNYNPDNTAKYTFSGKRVKRGLYESKDGIRVNADANGAWNIGRKSNHEGFSQVCKGLLTSPLRISDLNVSLS
ncbi:mobile element protein [Geminocystis sp. NIES-3708]|uniref:RNA-guided endonuclease InsQ/TnpB family protein n=1 Tax=Geminocystis sp. NIES-3708 TaxID=1615909 RepID=UPI0005FC4928|nr:RNA-guided endonuclease TnpB family protein [Geminocystis sp. NIES-3708]BAQ62768.1 mobile element protein [Geminocystis sp. NIES-3708]